METYVIYVNDKVHALNQVVPLLEDAHAARWVLVACPPRVSRHTGKWLTQRALKKFRNDWTEQNLQELVLLLRNKGHTVLTRTAHGPLKSLTQALKAELGDLRVIDARQVRPLQNLVPVVEQQKPASDPWLIPAGAIAFGTMISLTVD